MLPSILAEQLQDGARNYLSNAFPMTNEPFAGSLDRAVRDTDLLSQDPYISLKLPFRPGDVAATSFDALDELPFVPHLHQQKAFVRLMGDIPKSTLIATGTGSGKTEAFLYPILEYCAKHPEKGVKALLIYPMNALASDQAKRIARLIHDNSGLRGNVSAGMYVGQETTGGTKAMCKDHIITDHAILQQYPPDILLTNYKMLDYLLVRPADAAIWQFNDPDTLKFIVVDEMHTYDGAQGTDLACLLRRLKHRLKTPQNHLCCIGTSATMGTKADEMTAYATEIFGEPMDEQSVIVEDRLTADEFLRKSKAAASRIKLPSQSQLDNLAKCVTDENQSQYLMNAANSWFSRFGKDVLTEKNRVSLGSRLRSHPFIAALICLLSDRPMQVSEILEELKPQFPQLEEISSADQLIYSAVALISHARSIHEGRTRPFLDVHVHVWQHELRRLLAKVDPKDVAYSIALDLNEDQTRQYLPVANCRQCGSTGWASTTHGEDQSVSIEDLGAFYNGFFSGGDILIMYPGHHEKVPDGMRKAMLCPSCMRIEYEPAGTQLAPECACGEQRLEVLVREKPEALGAENAVHYICPFCGADSVALVGYRGLTATSASLSQMYSSGYNDDKKTLVFSDNVQDAAHRAGFLNARTWRFGLRRAIREVCMEESGAYYWNDGHWKMPLSEFQDAFLDYWRGSNGHLTPGEYISNFIAPDMVWMRAYENMLANRSLKTSDPGVEALMEHIDRRLRYEIMLEYGLHSPLGNTLQNTMSSTLEFDQEDIARIAHRVRDEAIGKADTLRDVPLAAFEYMVIGFLTTMRENGAFKDDVFNGFVENKGQPYWLTAARPRLGTGQSWFWLPPMNQARNVPIFQGRSHGWLGMKDTFDEPRSRKYTDWIRMCLQEHVKLNRDDLTVISDCILDAALKEGVLQPFEGTRGYDVYGIDKDRVYVSKDLKRMQCNECGATYVVAQDEAPSWTGAPCRSSACTGTLQVADERPDTFYGRLYSSGSLERINAKEHTGLLSRAEREKLEEDFKRSTDRMPWDPNLLSCTPTLEMGVDIGDLSSVVLGGVPPTQNHFLQRIGRAGREDGNALTLTVASARPHDAYFYADPLEMIAGDIAVPKVYLRASAVLERQFVAFCMDEWVKDGEAKGAIPPTVGEILARIKDEDLEKFPFNFLQFIADRRSELLDSFLQMFGTYLDEDTKESVRAFAQGGSRDGNSLQTRIVGAFKNVLEHRQSILDSLDKLRKLIWHIRNNKPKDTHYDDEIRKLEREYKALKAVVADIDYRDVFEFMTNEGLLPNYMFPEAGIVLKAVLSERMEAQETETGGEKENKTVYTYNRGGASALFEFAPSNSFYAGGRRLPVDQVDLSSSKPALWHLCPECAYAALQEETKNTTTCPRCGSPRWADVGQIRPMLKVQMVYSNVDYESSLIGDEAEDRFTASFESQMLVDVDEEKDVVCAYQVGGDDCPFGYEFVRKATMRQINFGESRLTGGDMLSVAGEEAVRRGFRVCKECGKVQIPGEDPIHTSTCSAKDKQAEDCLFLYREFQTEAIRMLIPATTLDPTRVKEESFAAAFQLGMREYFGNVDHLRTTVTKIPVQGMSAAKEYLVIYDSVPGGTGYLEQLIHDKDALLNVLQKALDAMEHCLCAEDPEKDGCYHCLYGYRRSRKMNNISRKTAISMLRAILQNRDDIKEVPTLSAVSTRELFDSALEQQFVLKLRKMLGEKNVEATGDGQNIRYTIRCGDNIWEMQPQVMLGPEQGVATPSKPDFVIRPAGENAADCRSIAVFTDGFAYHKDEVADDLRKRNAIRASDDYRVWALSYKDVVDDAAQDKQSAAKMLDVAELPSAGKYEKLLKKRLTPDEQRHVPPLNGSSLDMLLKYLSSPDPEKVFSTAAFAYAYGSINRELKPDETADLKKHLAPLLAYAGKGTVFDLGPARFGMERPSGQVGHARFDTSVTQAVAKVGGWPTVIAFLEDKHQRRAYAADWNAFWKFYNFMQFNPEFLAMCASEIPAEKHAPLTGWALIASMLFTDEAKAFAAAAEAYSIPCPNEDDVQRDIGEKTDDGVERVVGSVEIAWPEKKAAYMTVTDARAAEKEDMEALGWQFFDESSLAALSELLGS